MNRENIVMAPPYDITHTLIYPTIDNKPALKMDDNKAFPDYKTLKKFGESFDIKKCGEIIESTATSITDYINSSADIHLMPGLKESIEKSLSQAKASPNKVNAANGLTCKNSTSFATSQTIL